MVSIRRDAGAPTDAGCLTTPFGRCDKPLSKLVVAETNEEIIVVTRNDGFKQILTMIRANSSQEEINHIIENKLDQIKLRYDNLLENGKEDQARDLLGVDSADYFCLCPVSLSKYGSQYCKDIVTVSNNRIIDSLKAIPFFDEKANTWEIGQPTEIILPEGTTVSSIVDGENYNRETNLTNIENLEDEEMTSTLSNYYKLIA